MLRSYLTGDFSIGPLDKMMVYLVNSLLKGNVSSKLILKGSIALN